MEKKMEDKEKEEEQNKYLDWFVQKPYKAGVWTGRKAETGTKYASATAAAVPLPVGSYAVGTVIGFCKNLAKDLSWFSRFFSSDGGKKKPRIRRKAEIERKRRKSARRLARRV